MNYQDIKIFCSRSNSFDKMCFNTKNFLSLKEICLSVIACLIWIYMLGFMGVLAVILKLCI